MFRRLSILAMVAAIALLAVTSTAEAASRHARNKIPPAPTGTKLPPEVPKAIKAEFPTGKVTGIFLEENKELEVMVTVPGSPVIEVVFLRRGATWHLAGYEYPVPAAALTPRANTALKAKYPKGKILEVELVFNGSWGLLGYQVEVQSGNSRHEEFIHANGTFGKDPL